MSRHHGFGGVIKVGDTSPIGELQSWNIDEQVNVTEGYSMGQAWADNQATVKKWSGSATARYDDGDAGQISLSAGDAVDLHFYPGGDASGKPTKSGPVIVTGSPMSANKDGWTEIVFNFVGNGALATGTVA
ncbi:MAG: hypothetical protein ACI8Q6_003594 [Granulosicoccus sp.]|jgi:hypothetical protein